MRNNTYFRLFIDFFKIGLFTIGGGFVMLPYITKTVVDDEKWLTEEEMIDGIAVAQSLPGVVAVNTATYVGKKTKGTGGAVAATLGVILPSFIIIILISLLLGAVRENEFVDGALIGVRACAAGLIALAGIRLGKDILKDPFSWVVAVLAFLIVTCIGLNVVYVIIAAAIAGVIANAVKKQRRMT